MIAIATVTRVVGKEKGDGEGNKKSNGKGNDEKGDGNGNEEGNGDQRQQHGQWLRQRGWQAFDGGNDGDSAKDTAAHATTGERGMMVALSHGLYVCFGVCGDFSFGEEKLVAP